MPESSASAASPSTEPREFPRVGVRAAASGVAPARRLWGAAALLVAFGLVATMVALTPPWLGLRLGLAAEGDRVVVLGSTGPSSTIPPGATIVAIAERRLDGTAIAERRLGGTAIAERGLDGTAIAASEQLLEPHDLIEEPDYFDTYPEMASFFARQTALAQVLEAPTVVVRYRTDAGEKTVAVAPQRRPLRSLPALFWFPLVSGLLAALVGLWVAILRPERGTPNARGAVLFAGLGVTIAAFTAPAAIYGTRELAISGGTFRVLSTLNHLGAFSFGIFLVLLFLSFPRPFAPPRASVVVPAIFVPWMLADAFRILPDQNFVRVGILLQMIAAIVVALVGWFAAKRDPAARATLRWFGASVLVGSSLYVFTTVGTSVLGGIPSVPQGYAFGFFFLMFLGLAIGVRRHALFELNTWAYRILLGVVGAVALVAVDAVLAALLPTSRGLATAVALLAVGAVYLPARSWLWGRVVGAKIVENEVLFRELLAVTFVKDAREMSRSWRTLLEKTFLASSLELTKEEAIDLVDVRLEEDGISLFVPGISVPDSPTEVPPFRLRYPWEGRGLFGERHRVLVRSAHAFLTQAIVARDAFARGAREERTRIAGDLHDDVGARLLTSLHGEDLGGTRASVRLAIGEMRGIVNELVGRTQPLDLLEGDLRHETTTRGEAAGLRVDWPLSSLTRDDEAEEIVVSYRFARHLASILRELVSNTIRHAEATTITVCWRLHSNEKDSEMARDTLVLTVSDDGRGFAAGEKPGSNGLAGISRRVALLGGQVQIDGSSGTTVTLTLPTADAANLVENSAEVLA